MNTEAPAAVAGGGSPHARTPADRSRTDNPRLNTKHLALAAVSAATAGAALAAPNAMALSQLYCNSFHHANLGCTQGPHISWSANQARNESGEAACVNEYYSFATSRHGTGWTARTCHNAGLVASQYLCCSVSSGYVQAWNGSTDTFTLLHGRRYW